MLKVIIPRYMLYESLVDVSVVETEIPTNLGQSADVEQSIPDPGGNPNLHPAMLKGYLSKD